MATEANDRLRDLLHQRRVGIAELAKHADVDRKTVERWLTGRTPYRTTQATVAAFLDVDPEYLWPTDRPDTPGHTAEEIVAAWPNRSAAPPGLWADTLSHAEHHLDVLVYAGFWLSEDPRFRQVLADRAAAGAQVRILLGDPDSTEVRRRSEEEQLGPATIPAKIRNTIVNYRQVLNLDHITFRLHATPLYNSLFRADDTMLVNPHIFGSSAYVAPIFKIKACPSSPLFSAYTASFERIWATARPLNHPET